MPLTTPMPATLCSSTIVDDLNALFESFESMWDTTGNEQIFTVSDSTFICRTDFSGYSGTVKKAMANRRAGHHHTCRILAVHSGLPGRPDILWGEKFFNERQIESLLAKTPFRLHYYDPKGFWQIFHLTKRIGLQLMPGEHGVPDWDSGSPLRNFIHWHLASGQTGLIHAGTLAIDRDGVLLAGAGGSGKSSTVLSGLVRGMTTVGDDYVFADCRSGVLVRPLFNTLKQDTEGLQRAGLNNHPNIPKDTNWQGKHQFFLNDIDPDAPADRINIKAILLPRATGSSTTEFRPSTSKTAFLALAPSGVSQIHGDRQKSFAIAGKIARALPCWTLELGTNADEITDKIRQFIEECS